MDRLGLWLIVFFSFVLLLLSLFLLWFIYALGCFYSYDCALIDGSVIFFVQRSKHEIHILHVRSRSTSYILVQENFKLGIHV